MGRKFGFSFSWKRALGISSFKGKVSRFIGIPLTKSGRQRKAGRLLGDVIGSALIAGTELALQEPTAHEARTPHPSLPVPTKSVTFAFSWPEPVAADALPQELGLTPRALKLATEKPRGWEYLLFAQVMLDETRKAKRHLARGNTTPPEPSDIKSVVQFLDWTSERLAQYELLCGHVSKFSVTNDNPALGPPGQPGAEIADLPRQRDDSRNTGSGVFPISCVQSAARWPLVFHDVARELQRFAERSSNPLNGPQRIF